MAVQAGHPRRRSARIAAQKGQATTLDKENVLPSPSTSDLYAVQPLPRENKKRKHSEDQDPIEYWTAHHTWPKNLGHAMSSKRTKRSINIESRSTSSRRQSWSEQRKGGLVPEPYSREYELLMHTRGLHMNIETGRELVSQASEEICASFQEMTVREIMPKLIPKESLRDVILACQNRNEAIVNRDITTLIVPPIYSLRQHFSTEFEDYQKHMIDEVNQQWYDTCLLFGPRPQPDLAVGLVHRAFTEAERAKLDCYKSVDNWVQFTHHLWFPFFIGEIKCGRGGLDEADRQSMHAASVAVRAICRLEEEANKYRSEEAKVDINGQILVFSISHDEKDVRLYGHYAVCQNDSWGYYRYPIRFLSIFGNKPDLLTAHNFVCNVLSAHCKTHLTRLRDAISYLPEPTSISFVMSETSIGDAQSGGTPAAQPGATPFVKPVKPASVLREEYLVRQVEQLLEEQRKEREERDEQRVREREEHDEQLLRETERMGRILEDQRNERQEFRKKRDAADRKMEQLLEEHRQEKEEYRRAREAADRQISQLQQILSQALLQRAT